MFFKKNAFRKAAVGTGGDNSLFFTSLTVAVVAFYSLLSLGEMDVMRFLAEIESDAVNKVLMLLPIVYAFSLFLMFFLVLFAYKYRAQTRRREFGIYLLMGMSRSRLFLRLFGETVISSIISLLIGIPVSLFLTETISLATARFAGMGIIEHRFAFSPYALILTAVGVTAVQLLSTAATCISLADTEPAALLQPPVRKNQKIPSRRESTVCFIFGILLLCAAYVNGLFFLPKIEFGATELLVVSGVCGTFLVFRGLGGIIGKRITKKTFSKTGLAVFNARQLQENVTGQHKNLAIASLLLLASFASLSYGASVGLTQKTEKRSVDFSLFGDEAAVESVLNEPELKSVTKTSYDMYLSQIRSDRIPDYSDFLKFYDGQSSWFCEYVIALSSYNALRTAMGKQPLALKENEAAMYSDLAGERGNSTLGNDIEKVLEKGVNIVVNGKNTALLPELLCDKAVADRSITLFSALVVPDSVYFSLAFNSRPFCKNISLKDDTVNAKGLMNAISDAESIIKKSGLEYDSYLSGIGRNLFYSVTTGYLSVYIGVLFLLISNTVIGMKYLIMQRESRQRYVTLSRLGASADDIIGSVATQINGYFALVLSVSVISGVFAVISVFSSFSKIPFGVPAGAVFAISAAAGAAFVLFECLYTYVVKRTAKHEITALYDENNAEQSGKY